MTFNVDKREIANQLVEGDGNGLLELLEHCYDAVQEKYGRAKGQLPIDRVNIFAQRTDDDMSNGVKIMLEALIRECC